MAKVRSIIKLSGTLSDTTFVDSRAYGAHGRAKRGTYTPITMAEGMKLSSLDLNQSNLMAKIIFDAVNEFAPGFKDGRFWSRLLSAFRKQKKADKTYNYADFKDIEMRPDYPTSKQGIFSLSAIAESVQLIYELRYTGGYSLSILRIAANETLLVSYPNEIREIQIKAHQKTGTAQYYFTPLPDDARILYVLKCERLKNGEILGVLKGKSVKFMRGF